MHLHVPQMLMSIILSRVMFARAQGCRENEFYFSKKKKKTLTVAWMSKSVHLYRRWENYEKKKDQMKAKRKKLIKKPIEPYDVI